MDVLCSHISIIHPPHPSEPHIQGRKQHRFSGWYGGTLSINYFLTIVDKKVNCLCFNMICLSICNSLALWKAAFWVLRASYICIMNLKIKKQNEKRSLLPYEEPHSANPSLLSRCHYRPRAGYQNKDPVLKRDKNIQFSAATHLEQTLRI